MSQVRSLAAGRFAKLRLLPVLSETVVRLEKGEEFAIHGYLRKDLPCGEY